jgi:hypothetical protein
MFSLRNIYLVKSGYNLMACVCFYVTHGEKKSQELNQIVFFSNFTLLGNVLSIFVVVMHVILCLAALYLFPINTSQVLVTRTYFKGYPWTP